MIETINLYLIKKGKLEDAQLFIHDKHDAILLHFVCKSSCLNIKEIDSFPFIAFQRIRSLLEASDIYILCQASRFDVYPSGMQLESFFAYELEIGKPATSSVYIFDFFDKIDKIGTVNKQEIYFNNWIESLVW